MTNYQSGHDAEKSAAKYLESLGYKILDINWSTPRCEIDIVAQKDDVVHLIEVKYRKSLNHGSGVDYITPKKLKQMAFAAEVWVSHTDWSGDYQLGVIESSASSHRLISDIP
jgi:putative endonuclease